MRAMQTDMLKKTLDDLILESHIEGRKKEATGVASKTAKMRELRRSRARILTILKERGVTN